MVGDLGDYVTSLKGFPEWLEAMRDDLARNKYQGRGEGPFYGDDEFVPWTWYSWTYDAATGEYVDPQPRHTNIGYQYGPIPWPHCAICNDRLAKVGPNARCGRHTMGRGGARTMNPPPCEVCCETGRIVCAECCAADRAGALVAKRNELAKQHLEMRQSVVPLAAKSPKVFCYFIEGVGSGLVKIGHAIDPKARMRDISTMSPVPLKLIAAFPGGEPVERALHRKLCRVRSHGEWFKDGPELRAELDHLVAWGTDAQGRRKFTQKLGKLEEQLVQVAGELNRMPVHVVHRAEVTLREMAA